MEKLITRIVNYHKMEANTFLCLCLYVSPSNGVWQSHELVDIHLEQSELRKIADVSRELLKIVLGEMKVGERGQLRKSIGKKL